MDLEGVGLEGREVRSREEATLFQAGCEGREQHSNWGKHGFK